MFNLNLHIQACHFKQFWLLFLIVFAFKSKLYCQGNSIKEPGIPKKLMIECAQIAHGGHLDCKLAVFSKQPEQIDRYLDSAIMSLNTIFQKIDSVFAIASPSDTLALLYAERAKKFAIKSQHQINTGINAQDLNVKKNMAEKCLYTLSNVTTDAYNSSLYFNQMPIKKIEKQEESNVLKPTTKKEITKLDIDQTLFTLLKEEINTKLESNNSTIEKLNKELKSPALKPAEKEKIENQIKKLNQENLSLSTKNSNTDTKLKSINELIENRDKGKTVIANEEKTIFSKSKAINNEEWNKPIKSDNELPEGLIYQVQLGVFKKPVVPEKFKGLTPIYQKQTEEGVKYTTGMFETLSDVQEAKKYILSLGFTDAFITAYYNRKKISIAEASKIEKNK